MGFTTLDYSIVAIYLAGIALFGIILRGKQQTASDYFLGREVIPWWVVCLSIVAAETSTLTFISIPGLAYMSNMAFLQVAFGYLLGRVVVSLIFLPAYFRGELSTAYAFLERRFGAKTRSFASITFLFTRMAADGVRLFSTAIPLKFILDVDYPVAILILALVALAYTYVGGVRGVIWVDAIQMVVYLGGALVAVYFLASGFPGGWSAITSKAMDAGKFAFITPGFGRDFWHMPYTLLGGLIGGAFLSMASHGVDQLIIQRVLATKSLAASRRALVGSGVLVIIQFALFLFVGGLLWAHYNGASTAAMGLSRADEIFPRYIIDGLPPGFSGFIVAGLLAAALSTLAGSISSMASSTTLDLIKPYLSKALRPEKEIFLSRVVTIGFAAALVGSAMFFMNTTQTVVELALSISSFTYGGLLGTFLLGALFRRPREEDALAGFAAGIFIMISVISLKLVAWTWYTLVGVLATVAIGLLLSSLSRASGEAGPGLSRGSAAPK